MKREHSSVGVDGRGSHLVARIQLFDSRRASAIARALRRAECFAVRSGLRSVEVVLHARTDADADEARMELEFFVKAWADDHPGAAPRVVWQAA